MSTPKRKSLGQTNYEAHVRELAALEGSSVEDYAAWEQMDKKEQRPYIKGAVAVQRRDRERQRKDS